jgi:hydrogenase maturation protease
MPFESRPLLIVGCGNLLAGDDAFGPRVVEALQARQLPGAEIVDLGMRPFGLAERLEDCKELVIVDAAEASEDFPPGRLIVVDYFAERRPALRQDVALSTHGLSIAAELELARQLGTLPPRVSIVAATVEQATPGQPMTAETRRLVRSAVETVIRMVLARRRDWSASHA